MIGSLNSMGKPPPDTPCNEGRDSGCTDGKGDDQLPLLLSLFRLNLAARRAFGQRMSTETWAHDKGLRPGCFGVLRVAGANECDRAQPGSPTDPAEPIGQKELGERLGLDPSDVVGLVDTLERAGYLLRERDRSDRRRNVLHLTPSGRTAVDRLNQIAEDVDDALFAGLSADERATLDRLIRRVLIDNAD